MWPSFTEPETKHAKGRFSFLFDPGVSCPTGIFAATHRFLSISKSCFEDGQGSFIKMLYIFYVNIHRVNGKDLF